MQGNPRDDFESLARRYWAAWGDALRSAAPGMGAIPGMGGPHMPPPGVEAWQDSLDWWARLVHGGRAEADDAVGHFNRQARQWYARMQEVAARFAGQENNAVDVARAWKEALGAAGENPFPEMLRSLRGLRGHGLQGLEQWVEDASPWLQSMRDESASWLRMPAFGAGREHQERMQQLAGHMAEYQQAFSAYAALMAKAQQEAFLIFENRLIDHEEPGRQLQSARALFDLWIDAAEEAYAEIALSPEFRDVYGRLVNAQMRVRAGVQRMVEDASAQLGMPTRSELDGAHRKLAQLEREVRRLRDALARSPRPDGARRQAGDPASEAVAGTAPGTRARAAAKRSGGGSAAAKRASRKPVRAATTAGATRRSPTATATTRRGTAAAAAPGVVTAARAPKAPAKRASSTRSGFGGAISGAVPRAPEPIAKKAAKDAKAAKPAKPAAKKPAVKKPAGKTAGKSAGKSAKKGKR